MSHLNIISYNVNGIRAAIKRGWIDWVGQNNFDIIGIQESKAEASQVDISGLEALGYHYNYWFSSTRKKGYSGVAIFSKIKADYVACGMGDELWDSEGRVIRADFGDITILNCYFPNGASSSIRQGLKMEFLPKLYDMMQELQKTRPNIIVQGDYNIAHNEIDLFNPKANKKTSGFLPEERAWMESWFTNGGFHDSFRVKNPDTVKYSWWDMRSFARLSNKGWRIDYQGITTPLLDRLVHADLLNDAEHSDHCPCLLTLQMP